MNDDPMGLTQSGPVAVLCLNCFLLYEPAVLQSQTFYSLLKRWNSKGSLFL